MPMETNAFADSLATEAQGPREMQVTAPSYVAPPGALAERPERSGVRESRHLAAFKQDLRRHLASRAVVVIEPVLGGVLKRLFDIAAASAGLILLSPLFLVVACIMRMQDGGSIFYGQWRMGYGGRPFRCWKFRSMVLDADKRLFEHLRDNPEAASEWRATQKLKMDPRVTPLGAMLRKTSLDELPQLLNILLGEMSVVGPRPVVHDELTRFGASMRHYVRCRPGLTGLWQVSGRSQTTYQKRVELDRRYVATWSLMKDFGIILRTGPALLFSRGAY